MLLVSRNSSEALVHERNRNGEQAPVAADPLEVVHCAKWSQPSHANGRILQVLIADNDRDAADTLAMLTTRPYAVTPAADRVGVRLTGPPLRRAVTREMWSEPTLRGAVEVPADGLPIVFGPDHPTTCGCSECTPARFPSTSTASTFGPALAAKSAAPASPPLPPLVETSSIVRFVTRPAST